MIKYIVIFIFLITFFPFTNVKSNPYNFGHIDYTNGLSNNRVLSFAEDNNGFLWIGTASGLNRYDGYNFKIFKHNPSDSTSISDNMVESITKDQLGRLWIGTPKGLIIFNPENEHFSTDFYLSTNKSNLNLYNLDLVIPSGDSILVFRAPDTGIILHNIYTNKNILLQPKLSNASVINTSDVSFMSISNGLLYILNRDGEINIVDIKTNVVIRNIVSVKSFFKNGNYTYKFYVDNNRKIWVYGDDERLGILIIDDKENVKLINTNTKPAINSNIIFEIIQDTENNYWIGTDHGGLNFMDSSLQNINYIKHDETNTNSLSQNVITTLYKSKNGIIWIGTFKQGANFYHKNLFRFFHFTHQQNNTNSLPYNDVSCFAEDKYENLWIGTNGQGLIYWDRKNNTFTTITSNQENNKGLKSNVIVSLYVDKANQLWIGSYHGGLAIYDGKTYTNYLNDPTNPKSISDNRVWDIFEDSKGNMWIGTLGGGLDLFDRNQKVFQHFSGTEPNLLNSKFVMNINEDNKGNIWFASDNGVFYLPQNSSNFINFTHKINNTESLSNNFASKIFIDSKQHFWIGTRDGLNLFDPEKKSFLRFNTNNGLPDNSIMGILESDLGDIWLSTTGGLCKLVVSFDENGRYKSHHTVNFNESDGLQGREFNESSNFKTSHGELIFGGSNGFNLFNPEKEDFSSKKFKTQIVGIEIFGKEIDVNSIDNKRKIISTSLLNNKTIKLSYKENIFSIKFVTIDYLGAKKISYRYKLEGFNSQWISTTWKDRKATFTNLNPGKYTFKVQSTDFNSVWSDSESSLTIIIQPPWYRTWAAYIIYYLFILILIIILRRTVILKEREKFKQDQITKESKRQEELNALKTRFFTNVSHEFRTPLTLIITPLEKLIKTNTDIETSKHLALMHQNAKRLLILVNQLLDFRKIEAEKVSIDYIYGNVISFIRFVIDSFADFRESKNIELDFLPDEKEVFMQFDKDKLEKIIFNLLSNAFKFTAEKGFIRVFTETVTIDAIEYLIITVKDNGIGISKEDQEKIFERFYQSNLPIEFITKGSGIGLSLTQDFVELMKGTISVESELGKGSKFIVKLPVNRNSAKNNWLETEMEQEVDLINDSNIALEQHTPSKKTILLVEDNAEFRYYLKDSLQEKFNILEAENGKLAIEQLITKQPDLVVSDIMMPEMDGLELCDEIKTNPSFSHIPVILLTAKSTQQDKLEGLKQGADEYITKPFSLDILEARINYLLAQREKFIKHYQKSFQIETENNSITPIDEKLLKTAFELINLNLSNSEFSVEKLSKELGMSRVYLYKKISSLTGKTPVELIRLVRLKKSTELLINSQLTISEIAYEVGFTDPRYFSKQFKAEFDVLPSKFKENQGIDM